MFNYQYCKLGPDTNIIISYSADSSYYIKQYKNKTDSTLVFNVNESFHDEKSFEALYFDLTFDGPKVYYTSKRNHKVIPLAISEFKNNIYKVKFPNDKSVYTLKMIRNKDLSIHIECINPNGTKQIFTYAGPMMAKTEELGNLIAVFNKISMLYGFVNMDIN